jgi:nucleoid DNA-binding protein
MKIKTYKRENMINKISYKLNMNKDESKIILDCVLDSFSELFLADDNTSRIELRNFGVFDVRITKERSNARNPKTKESVIIPKRKKIVFKVGKKIRTQLNHKFLS